MNLLLPGDLLVALQQGEEAAALEALEQWLRGDPGPMALCPLRAVEVVADLARGACEAGADPSAVATVGLATVRLFLERWPGGEWREPLREAVRWWVALVRAQSPLSERIRRAVAYLQAHYTDPHLREEAVAREACLSLSRFSREFHREIGVTYWDYLTDLRMEQARRLLAGPSLSLQEIGQRVGYRTQDTFSRAFKKAVGVTPRQYRQRLGGRVGPS